MNAQQTINTTCPRCDGSGHHSFNPTNGTVCFRCGGARSVKVTVEQATRYQQNRAEASAKLAARQGERQARIEAASAQAESEYEKAFNALVEANKALEASPLYAEVKRAEKAREIAREEWNRVAKRAG